MVYAKKMAGEEIVLLLEYAYQPEFSSDSGVVIISAEEYEELRKEILESLPVPERDPDEISDTEALAIITGEVEIDETE
jgi:hypothetical protein